VIKRAQRVLSVKVKQKPLLKRIKNKVKGPEPQEKHQRGQSLSKKKRKKKNKKIRAGEAIKKEKFHGTRKKLL